MEWLDPYEMRARMAPTIIVSLSLAITLFFIVHGKFDSLIHFLLGSGVILIVLIYALSFLVRHYGRAIEADLWTKWGGPPSTRFMRWRDSTFGDDLKQQFHAAAERHCEIKLMSKEEEDNNPDGADRQIVQAFSLVRAIVRHDDPEGVWTKHNAEYGFNRNLMGSRGIWLLFSIVGVVTWGVFWWHFKKDDILILVFGLAPNVLSAIVSIFGGWYLLPKFTKDAADRYAESIWNSFLASVKRKSK